MAIGLQQLRWLYRAASSLSAGKTLGGIGKAALGLRAPASLMARRAYGAARVLKRGLRPIAPSLRLARRIGVASPGRFAAALGVRTAVSGGRALSYLGRGVGAAWRATPNSSRYLAAGAAGLAAGGLYARRRRQRYY